MVCLLCLKARLHLLQDGGKQQRQGLERRRVCGLQDGLAGCRQTSRRFSHHSAGALRHPSWASELRSTSSTLGSLRK